MTIYDRWNFEGLAAPRRDDSARGHLFLSSDKFRKTAHWRISGFFLFGRSALKYAAMPSIKILPHSELAPDGAVIRADAGVSVCDALLAHGVDIEHACEKSCACTTCHVVVRQGFDSLNQADDTEEDLLDKAWGVEPESRLSCQAIVDDRDLVVEIPRYTINHAKEEH